MKLFDTNFSEISLDEIEKLKENRIPESLNLDYKREFRPGSEGIDSKELAKDVSSFANSSGGYLIYGIESDKGDYPKNIVGLEYDPKSKFKEKIEQIIRTSISGNIQCRVKLIEYKRNRAIIVIYVPKSSNAPHRVEVGKDHRYYTRGEFESRRMSEEEIRQLYNENSRQIESIKEKFDKIHIRNYKTSPHPMILFFVSPVGVEEPLFEIDKENKDFFRQDIFQLFKHTGTDYTFITQEYIFVNSSEKDELTGDPIVNEFFEAGKNGCFTYGKRILYNVDKSIAPAMVLEQLIGFIEKCLSYYDKYSYMGELAISVRFTDIKGFWLVGTEHSMNLKKVVEDEMDTGILIVDSEDLKANSEDYKIQLMDEIYRFFGFPKSKFDNSS